MGIWHNVHESNLTEATKANVDIVFSAFQSMRCMVAYTSMPITTGKLLYEVLDRYGVKTQAELNDKLPGGLFKEVIAPNIKNGTNFADQVAKRTSLPVIAPAIFEAKKQRWGQSEYMALWIRLIEQKVKEIHLDGGWEYSDGGSEEFTMGAEMQFKFCERNDVIMYDSHGQEIRYDQGFFLIMQAINNLRERGFEPLKLQGIACRLWHIAAFQYDYLTTRSEYHFHQAYRCDMERVYRLGLKHWSLLDAGRTKYFQPAA